VEQDFSRLVFDSLQTRPNLAFSDESLMSGGEVHFALKVHEILTVGHCLSLLEVSAVRDAVNLVLCVFGILCHSHRSVNFHFRCFQPVVNLVHMLLKSSNFMAPDKVLVQGKDQFGDFVLSLFLESSAQNDLGKIVRVRDVHTCSICHNRKGVIEC